MKIALIVGRLNEQNFPDIENFYGLLQYVKWSRFPIYIVIFKRHVRSCRTVYGFKKYYCPRITIEVTVIVAARVGVLPS